MKGLIIQYVPNCIKNKDMPLMCVCVCACAVTCVDIFTLKYIQCICFPTDCKGVDTIILCDDNHTEVFKMTKKACSKWKGIGRELGFTEEELSTIVREPGQTGEEDYYSAMLMRWLDWAPPNHYLPSVQQLTSALRAVGKERLAFELDVKYSQPT